MNDYPHLAFEMDDPVMLVYTIHPPSNLVVINLGLLLAVHVISLLNVMILVMKAKPLLMVQGEEVVIQMLLQLALNVNKAEVVMTTEEPGTMVEFQMRATLDLMAQGGHSGKRSQIASNGAVAARQLVAWS
eukprot:s4554_g1.t1